MTLGRAPDVTIAGAYSSKLRIPSQLEGQTDSETMLGRWYWALGRLHILHVFFAANLKCKQTIQCRGRGLSATTRHSRAINEPNSRETIRARVCYPRQTYGRFLALHVYAHVRSIGGWFVPSIVLLSTVPEMTR